MIFFAFLGERKQSRSGREPMILAFLSPRIKDYVYLFCFNILQITRVIRRTSPQQSPSSSPPTTRHGSSDQLSRPAAESHGMYRVSLSFNP